MKGSFPSEFPPGPSRTPPPIPDHELLRRIGAGAYGEVWLARTVTGVLRAVKVVYRANFDHDRPYEREFEGIRKFEPVSRSHEGLMDVLQVGRSDVAGCFYYVMELADDAIGKAGGEAARPASELSPAQLADYAPKTLAAELKRRQRFTPAECGEIGLALTAALEHLHGCDLVHRDIKPSNIIYVGGVLKLADIGLVTEPRETRSHVGTEGYIPPEGSGTVPGDLFSLGKVLYELATGKARDRFPEPPTDLAAMPERDQLQELNEVILKACEPDHRLRYRNATEMRGDLFLLQGGKSLQWLRQAERRLKLLRKAALLGLLLLALIAGAYFFQRQQSRRFQALAEVNRQTLVQLNVANGTHRADDGDLFGALLWYTKALEIEAGNPERERVHRLRINAVLQQCPRLAALGMHKQPIITAAFSPDGRWVATGSEDGSVRVWESEGGQPLTPMLLHTGAVRSVCFSPDGRKVLSASEDGTARAWEAARGAPAFPPLRHADKVLWATFSPDGRFIATASSDKTAGLWNATNGISLGKVFHHENEVRKVAFSPDGSRLATASEDRTARIWDIASGEALTPPLRHDDDVRHLVFSPDGKLLVSTSGDETARVWETATGKSVTEPLRHAGPVFDAQFSMDGKWLVTAGGGAGRTGEVRIWNTRTWRPNLASIRHKRAVNQAAFSPDGRWIVTSSGDQTARVWSAADGEPITPWFRHDQSVRVAQFDPDGRRVLTASRDGVWRVWDLATAQTLTPMVTLDSAVRWMELDADGGRLLVMPHVGSAKVFESTTLEGIGNDKLWTQGQGELWRLSPNGQRIIGATIDGWLRLLDVTTGIDLQPPAKLTNQILDVAFRGDGRPLVVTRAENGDAFVQLADTLEIVAGPLPPQRNWTVRRLCFNPDWTLLLIGWGVGDYPAAGEWRLWNLTTGKPVSEPRKMSSHPDGVAFSRDGRLLATSWTDSTSEPRYAEINDARTGKVLSPHLWHSDGVPHVEFSPDSRYLATAGEDGLAKIWDTTTFKQVGKSLRHQKTVMGATFSPDNRFIATASHDHTARVWDARTGEAVTPWLPHEERVDIVKFTPDGRQLITCSGLVPDAYVQLHRAYVRLWDVSTDERPIKTLKQLAQLLRGTGFDGSADEVSLSSADLERLFKELRAGYPGSFAPPLQVAERWHERQATFCEGERNWSAAAFHLKKLKTLKPRDSAISERLNHALTDH